MYNHNKGVMNVPTQKPRVTITVDEDQLNEIEDYRFKNRMKNQTQAILSLIEKGLDELSRSNTNNEINEYRSRPNSDVRKERLSHNYDALNNDGRQRLVDYSDDLVSGGRYVNKMPLAAHGGGVTLVDAPDPSKKQKIERLTKEALDESYDEDEEF